MTSFPLTPDEKDVGRCGIARAFVHHVITHRLQGFWLEEIDDPFRPRFCSRTFRVIGSIPDHDPLSSVLDIAQLKREGLPWAQTSVKHEQEHRFVALLRERLQKLAYLLVIHRTRNALDRFDMHRSSHGLLPAGISHERSMAFRHTGQSSISHLLNVVLALSEGACKDE